MSQSDKQFTSKIYECCLNHIKTQIPLVGSLTPFEMGRLIKNNQITDPEMLRVLCGGCPECRDNQSVCPRTENIGLTACLMQSKYYPGNESDSESESDDTPDCDNSIYYVLDV